MTEIYKICGQEFELIPENPHKPKIYDQVEVVLKEDHEAFKEELKVLLLNLNKDRYVGDYQKGRTDIIVRLQTILNGK